MLATILSHLNVIFLHIYSKIVAVFLTMALLFRCLLAYRLKKKGHVPPKVYSGYAHGCEPLCQNKSLKIIFNKVFKIF